MVRLKLRYVLFDIVYPPELDNTEELVNVSASPLNALLSLHQTSPTVINQKTLSQAIRKVIQDHYGDFGAGTAGMQLTVKYFSNKTSTGIIRCSRLSFPIVISALALMNTLGGRNITIRCLHVSGTIKKCEQFCIQRNRSLICKLRNEPSSDKTDTLIKHLQEEKKKGVLGVVEEKDVAF